MRQPSEKLARLTQQAVAAHQAGDAGRAERLFREAARLKPPQPPAAYNLGVFLRQVGKPREAATWLVKAVQADPNNSVAQIELGLARLDEDAPTEALSVLAAALARAPDDPDAVRGTAVAAFRLGQWQQACEAYGRLDMLGHLGEADGLAFVRALLEVRNPDMAEKLARRLGAAEPDLAPELLKAVTRRSCGVVSLDEAALARRWGLRSIG